MKRKSVCDKVQKLYQGGKIVTIKLHFYSYAAKSDLEKATGVDTWTFTGKSSLN